MGISFAAPLSSLQTTFIRQDVTANNIANVNTPGFAQQDVQQAEMRTGGVRVSSITRNRNDSVEFSNVDLAQQMTELMMNKELTKIDAKVIKVKDQMLGTLIDMVG